MIPRMSFTVHIGRIRRENTYTCLSFTQNTIFLNIFFGISSVSYVELPTFLFLCVVLNSDITVLRVTLFVTNINLFFACITPCFHFLPMVCLVSSVVCYSQFFQLLNSLSMAFFSLSLSPSFAFFTLLFPITWVGIPFFL